MDAPENSCAWDTRVVRALYSNMFFFKETKTRMMLTETKKDEAECTQTFTLSEYLGGKRNTSAMATNRTVGGQCRRALYLVHWMHMVQECT